MFGNESFRTLLSRLMNNNTTINEVVLEGDALDLMGVTVQSVQANYVEFNEVGSPGVGTIYVPIDKIVAIDV